MFIDNVDTHVYVFSLFVLGNVNGKIFALVVHNDGCD